MNSIDLTSSMLNNLPVNFRTIHGMDFSGVVQSIMRPHSQRDRLRFSAINANCDVGTFALDKSGEVRLIKMTMGIIDED